jgi:hypothetical protein
LGLALAAAPSAFEGNKIEVLAPKIDLEDPDKLDESL